MLSEEETVKFLMDNGFKIKYVPKVVLPQMHIDPDQNFGVGPTHDIEEDIYTVYNRITNRGLNEI